MQTIIVTGSKGFIGKNFIEGLRRVGNIEIKGFDIHDDIFVLRDYLKEADFIFHFAGVNRPENVAEFEVGNVDLTRTMVDLLEKNKRNVPIVLTSSIQAEFENPYGVSKKKAENILIEYRRKNRVPIYIYRLPNVFGKWCRPNYNSVVATFCYNIAHGIDIQISDVNRTIELVYIDDVVTELISILSQKRDARNDKDFFKIDRVFKTTLGDLAKRIYRLDDMRKTLVVPDFQDDFMKCLYATYLSYMDKDQFSYLLDTHRDPRGTLVELLKSQHFGQIFVSTSHRGIVRGNHYHNTKVEKFCVLKGEGVIKFRHIFEEETLSYFVSDEKIEIVDIPPGYTHCIENLGDSEMIVLFWANQIFDPQKTDTYFEEV